jgi:hypothetical protein
MHYRDFFTKSWILCHNVRSAKKNCLRFTLKLSRHYPHHLYLYSTWALCLLLTTTSVAQSSAPASHRCRFDSCWRTCWIFLNCSRLGLKEMYIISVRYFQLTNPESHYRELLKSPWQVKLPGVMLTVDCRVDWLVACCQLAAGNCKPSLWGWWTLYPTPNTHSLIAPIKEEILTAVMVFQRGVIICFYLVWSNDLRAVSNLETWPSSPPGCVVSQYVDLGCFILAQFCTNSSAEDGT